MFFTPIELLPQHPWDLEIKTCPVCKTPFIGKFMYCSPECRLKEDVHDNC